MQNCETGSYPSMNIVSLGLFSELASRVLAVDHSSSQGNGLGKDLPQERRSGRMLDSINAAFGKS
jgi:hypothetical protein